MPIPPFERAFQAALEASVATHFPDNTTINCMCHSTENLFRTTASALVRASDDFYPRDPSSSGPHIGACAYNAVFLAGILHPDYDMFHSRHPAARAHAAAARRSVWRSRIDSGQPSFSVLRAHSGQATHALPSASHQR